MVSEILTVGLEAGPFYGKNLMCLKRFSLRVRSLAMQVLASILVFLPQIEMVPVFSNFLRLMECGMDPIVLMDGSFETAKKPTLYSRAKDQARTSVACFPSTHHKNIVLPMLAKGNDNFFNQSIFSPDVNVQCE